MKNLHRGMVDEMMSDNFVSVMVDDLDRRVHFLDSVVFSIRFMQTKNVINESESEIVHLFDLIESNEPN